jgi:hypothetical protein
MLRFDLTEFRTCFTHLSRIFNSHVSVVAENNPTLHGGFQICAQNRAEMRGNQQVIGLKSTCDVR